MASMKSNDLWNILLQIRAWTPLSHIPIQVESSYEGVYNVGDGAYLVTQQYDRNLEMNKPNAPFITMVIWASSLNALKRCLNSNDHIEADASCLVPPEILLLGTKGDYNSILKKCSVENQKIAERAVYSNIGKFVHKIIEIDNLRYCFLCPKIKNDDMPYAIMISLKA